jgi:hypothetical protein
MFYCRLLSKMTVDKRKDYLQANKSPVYAGLILDNLVFMTSQVTIAVAYFSITRQATA